MCQFTNQQQNQQQPSWNNEHARRQEQLYPNLDEILDNILPQNQSQFLRDFFANRNQNDNHQEPSAPPRNQNDQPTAPPYPENHQESRNQGFGGGWNWNWNGPNHQSNQNHQNRQNWNGNEMDELSDLLQRFGHRFVMTLTKSIGFLMLFFPILLMPKCLLTLGILAAVIKSFGLPLTPLLITGFLWEILSAFDPIFVTFMALYVFYKTVLRGKPLIDLDFWRHRSNSRCRFRQ